MHVNIRIIGKPVAYVSSTQLYCPQASRSRPSNQKRPLGAAERNTNSPRGSGDGIEGPAIGDGHITDAEPQSVAAVISALFVSISLDLTQLYEN